MPVRVCAREALRAGEEDEPAELPTPPPGSGYKTATFAGGCFWCMEKPFDVVDGVLATTSGYTGGNQAHPTYHEVGAGATGHRESVQVLYDPAKVSYEQLLSVYWKQIDPTADDRMFLDQGMQYSSAIFVDGPEQRRAAEESLRALEVGTHSPASRSPFTYSALPPLFRCNPRATCASRLSPIRRLDLVWCQFLF